MNIRFGMPEILVIFSMLLYQSSQTFSIIAFIMGVLASVVVYAINFKDEEKEKGIRIVRNDEV